MQRIRDLPVRGERTVCGDQSADFLFVDQNSTQRKMIHLISLVFLGVVVGPAHA
ncbi:MAG: hypothetical protein WAV78_40905 [Xanthobacteraceae bacterium]|jgi:hypothetical protein